MGVNFAGHSGNTFRTKYMGREWFAVSRILAFNARNTSNTCVCFLLAHAPLFKIFACDCHGFLIVFEM